MSMEADNGMSKEEGFVAIEKLLKHALLSKTLVRRKQLLQQTQQNSTGKSKRFYLQMLSVRLTQTLPHVVVK